VLKAAFAGASEAIRALTEERDALLRGGKLLGQVITRHALVMEAARIEMLQTEPKQAMEWILNGLPDQWDDDETRWDGKETAQAWFDRALGWCKANGDIPERLALMPGVTVAVPPGGTGAEADPVAVDLVAANEELGEALARARARIAELIALPPKWAPADWSAMLGQLQALPGEWDGRAVDFAKAEAVSVANGSPDTAKTQRAISRLFRDCAIELRAALEGGQS
jgi:hypothetical protein